MRSSALGYCTTSGVTKMSVIFTYNGGYLILRQITCLYDMDIVFQPNGNFDEVYLYVGPLPNFPLQYQNLFCRRN